MLFSTFALSISVDVFWAFLNLDGALWGSEDDADENKCSVTYITLCAYTVLGTLTESCGLIILMTSGVLLKHVAVARCFVLF